MLMVAEENKVTGRSEGKRGGRGRETGLWTRRQETPADRLWLSCGREQSDRIVEALAEVESFWRFLRPAGQGKKAGGQLEPEPAELQRAAFGHRGPWCPARPVLHAPPLLLGLPGLGEACWGAGAGKEPLMECHFWRKWGWGKGPLWCLRHGGGSEQGQMTGGSLQGGRMLLAASLSRPALSDGADSSLPVATFLLGRCGVKAPAPADLSGTPEPHCPGLNWVPEPSSWTKTHT